jgi:hypothetical protein
MTATCVKDCKHFRDCSIDDKRNNPKVRNGNFSQYIGSRNAHLCPGFSRREHIANCQGCGNEVQHILKDAHPDPTPDYLLCSNCLAHLITLDLTKKQFKNLIKAGHTTREFYLHRDFYDLEGNALQPMI